MSFAKNATIDEAREAAIITLNAIQSFKDTKGIALFLKKGFISSLEDQSSPLNIFPLVSHPARCFDSYQVNKNAEEMKVIYEAFDNVLQLLQVNTQFHQSNDDSLDAKIEKYRNQSLLVINFLYLYFFYRIGKFSKRYSKLN